MASPLRGQPRIDYPCDWSYRLVGTCETSMRAVVGEVVGDDEHVLRSGRQSTGGRYVSLHLTVAVRDEAHRLEVYRRLGAADCVRTVL